MNAEIKIIINKILSETLDINSFEALDVFKNEGVLQDTTYFMLNGMKKILSSKTFDENGKLTFQEKYNKEGNYWELDDLINHKFEYLEPDIITETLYKNKQFYGNVVREFDEKFNLIKESKKNEDYEEDYIKRFYYTDEGQLLKIVIGTDKNYIYKEIHFIWDQASLKMIEVISYLQENRFYKEYYFITQNADSISVNLEGRGSVCEMNFKFKNSALSRWDYSIKRIGKIPNEERTLTINNPAESKKVVLKSIYRDRKFVSASKSVFEERLISEDLIEGKHKIRVIEIKNKIDRIDEVQLAGFLKDYA